MSSARGQRPAWKGKDSFEKSGKDSVPRETGEVLEVEKILRGKRSVNLLHRGEVYRLQVTKQGRLLLTK